jgi:hypothetical protein
MLIANLGHETGTRDKEADARRGGKAGLRCDGGDGLIDDGSICPC